MIAVAVIVTMMIPAISAAADNNNDGDKQLSRKERREEVKQAIKDAVVQVKTEFAADSIEAKMASVVSDDFSDTVFVWEDSVDNLDVLSQHVGVRNKISDEAETVIAVIAILAIFVFPLVSLIAIVWLIIWFSTRKSRDRNRLVAMSIERGIPLPPDYFRQIQRSRLQSGLVWVMWGIGIAVFFLIAVGAKTAAVLGLIPFLVGAAKLITYFVEDRPNKRD